MIRPDYLTPALANVFQRIQDERMQGVPVLNPALEVACVGFRGWQEYCLGVLITPWFMSLVMLPTEGEGQLQLKTGQKVTHAFPSGIYEFIVGDEPGIGRYLSCSLFSPVFEFADQEAAVATAEAVMAGLMDEQNRDTLSMREKEIAQIWRGETDPEADAADTGDGAAEDAPTLEQRLETPISRRDLLRGKFGGDRTEVHPEQG